MARPLSDDKRTAILEAAAEVVAGLGVSAPTAKIAKAAGVAEGTVFTYFATKDELLNQLYLEIKTDLRDAMMTGYPSGKSIAHRSRHVWVLSCPLSGTVSWELSGTIMHERISAVRGAGPVSRIPGVRARGETLISRRV